MRAPDTSMTAVTQEPDSTALTYNLVSCGDCEDFVHLPQGFEDWVDGFVTHGEGNAVLLNDHQIGNYVKE